LNRTIIQTTAKTNTKSIEIGNGISSNAIVGYLPFIYLSFKQVLNVPKKSPMGFEPKGLLRLWNIFRRKEQMQMLSHDDYG